MGVVDGWAERAVGGGCVRCAEVGALLLAWDATLLLLSALLVFNHQVGTALLLIPSALLVFIPQVGSALLLIPSALLVFYDSSPICALVWLCERANPVCTIIY